MRWRSLFNYILQQRHCTATRLVAALIYHSEFIVCLVINGVKMLKSDISNRMPNKHWSGKKNPYGAICSAEDRKQATSLMAWECHSLYYSDGQKVILCMRMSAAENAACYIGLLDCWYVGKRFLKSNRSYFWSRMRLTSEKWRTRSQNCSALLVQLKISSFVIIDKCLKTVMVGVPA